MTKASIQLSMNFIVMLIISLAVFGFGMILLFRIIMPQVTDVTDELSDSEIEATLNLLINKIVAMPYTKTTITRGESRILPVGIKNMHDSKEYFMIEVTCYMGLVPRKNEAICHEEGIGGAERCEGGTTTCDKWAINSGSVYHVPMKKTIVEKLFLNIPKDATVGDYSMKLKVYACSDRAGSNCEQYDTTKTFYVNVR